MKQIKLSLILLIPVTLFIACSSGKTIQRQMLNMRSELFYELTTPIYPDTIINTVYLKPVDYSAMLPYNTVKRKGGLIIPLLIFNYIQTKYDVTLGEYSLVQPYRDFLKDALLAQCNRSSCFDLKVCDNNFVLPDSALILEVKINKNVTTARMKNNGSLYFIPLGEDNNISGGSESWGINPPVSWLDISVRLMREEKCLWEKTYTATEDLTYKRSGITDPTRAYEHCIDAMTENLSYTTKSIVERISLNLHLQILMMQPN